MEYHEDRFEDVSLLIFKAEKLVAILPANKEESNIYSHQGLSYGGLVFSSKMKLQDVIIILKSVLEFLEKEGFSTLYLKSIPSIYCQYPNNEIDYLLFILKAKLQRRDILSVIDLRNELLPLSEVRKRGLKKANSNNLVIKEETDFDAFWSTILIPNLQKQHAVNPVHSLDEIKLLKSRFPNHIRQFNVYKDEEIVAGTTIFETKNVAHAQYISANETRQKLGSLDFLFNHLITTVFKDKAFFDFGASNENQGQNINEGLLYFKESFGARTIAQDFYKVEVANHKLLDAIFI